MTSDLENVSELIDRVRVASDGYFPNENVAELLRATTLVAIVGPMAVGKDTCIEVVTASDPKFHRVKGFTTRDPRPDETSYHFWGHNPQSLSSILGSLRSGELVQCVVHPTTGIVYGSSPSEYRQPFSVLDVLSSAVKDLEGLPFGSMRTVSLVVEPEQWAKRVSDRLKHISPKDVPKRLAEARQSLEWSLGQGEEAAWVLNADNGLEAASRDITAIARGLVEPQPATRTIGERLLRRVVVMEAA